MSVEALILLALVIVLPLIQQLTNAARRRNEGPPGPSGRPSPRTHVGKPPPPGPAVPPLPDTTPQTASDAIAAGDRMPAPHAGGPVTFALMPHHAMGRRTTVGLRTRRDLRRAIVLTAMLGPCRASSPYDGPERAGHP